MRILLKKYIPKIFQTKHPPFLKSIVNHQCDIRTPRPAWDLRVGFYHVFLIYSLTSLIYKTVSFVHVLGPLTKEYLEEPPFLFVTAPLINNSLNVSLNCLDIPQ